MHDTKKIVSDVLATAPDLEIFLVRNFTPFGVSVWHKLYNTPKFFQLLGVKCPTAVFIELHQNVMVCLRPRNEVVSYKQALSNCATKQHSKVVDWLQKGILLNEQAPTQLMSKIKSSTQLWEYLEDIFYFAGTFAYFLPLVQSDKIINDMCQQIRRESYYPAAIKAFSHQYAKERNISIKKLNQELLDNSIILGSGTRMIYICSNSQHIVYKVTPLVIDFVLTSLQDVVSTKLKGQTAYSGSYTGKAVLVFTIDDMISVKTGDILIAYSTNPRLLPAMKRAGAIITEEGGITSHAAILARELKKPCIVGMTGVMSSIASGITLRVDATQGFVRPVFK